MSDKQITKQTNKRVLYKHCTLEQAERYQNRLYDKYDSVKLVQFPTFSEVGVYAWHVSNPLQGTL